MHHGAYKEGEAAKHLGLPALANPYQNEVDRLAKQNIEADSKLYELASDWLSGWISRRAHNLQVIV